MKTMSLRTLAIVSGLACLNVYPVAQAESTEWNYPPNVKFESTLSRDEVRTEYIKAARDGTLTIPGEVGTPHTTISFQSSKTRDDVNAEYLQALKDGSLLQAGESPPTVAAIAFKSTLTREEVIAETLEWKRAQQRDVMMGGN